MSHSTSQYSFFDVENQMSKIHQLNNFLCRLNEAVNWEMFRDALTSVRRERIPSQGGRPPFDVILMFKILVLKATYNLSDEATELFIRDRLSFREFLGLTFADTVPDARTIWLFAETLKDQNMERYLFDLYNKELFEQGFAVKCGCIMDGTFVEVPVQHNTRAQNAQIKNGVAPDEFIENPHVISHKDTDARHAKNGDEEHFGYKNHVLVDDETKLVLDYAVTPASVHDSMECLDLMPPVPRDEGEEFYAYSAYGGSERNPIQEDLQDRGFTMQVCEKGVRNKPLTFLQRLCNNIKSRVRCRVEHVFGMQKKRMGDETLRTVGIQRANFWIGMRNLTNNMCRCVCLNGAK